MLGNNHGEDYKGNIQNNIKKAIDITKKNNAKIIFHSGNIQYASKHLFNESENLEQKRNKEFLSACIRSNLDRDKLLSSIEKWNSARIIVIGDVILDQYAACEPLGMSAEAPVLVVKELKSKNFIGGAGIVAANICSLGANCELISSR